MTISPLDRTVTLRFAGDPYGANLTRICNWLAYEVQSHSQPGSQCVIVPGDAGVENVRAVGNSEADVSVVTPSAITALAARGIGPFASQAYPQLRALGEMPHDDGLLLAVRAEAGVTSIADWRDRQLPLRVTIPLGGPGRPFTAYAVERVLDACGLSPETLRGWGGEVMARLSPYDCLDDIAAGRADAILHEAIMEPAWHALTAEHALSFLPLEPRAIAAMETELACPPTQIPGGYMPGLDEPVDTVDFSGFLVFTREDMADDLAFLLAQIMVETADRFTALNYAHLSVERSAVRYPVTRADVSQSPIPLHPAAARYYAQPPS